MQDLLEKHKNNDGYPVPEGYFEQLPNLVLDRIAKESAKAEAAEAAHPQHESDFPVPGGYFENLPNQVMARIEAEKASRFIVRRRFIRIASAAATAAVFVGVAFFFAHSVKNTKETISTHPTVAEASTPQKEKVMDAQDANLDDLVAQNNISEEVVVAPSRKSTRSASVESASTDPATDQFISEHLESEEMDVMDYDILDFYSDDMAVYDMWGW